MSRGRLPPRAAERRGARVAHATLPSQSWVTAGSAPSPARTAARRRGWQSGLFDDDQLLSAGSTDLLAQRRQVGRRETSLDNLTSTPAQRLAALHSHLEAKAAAAFSSFSCCSGDLLAPSPTRHRLAQPLLALCRLRRPADRARCSWPKMTCWISPGRASRLVRLSSSARQARAVSSSSAMRSAAPTQTAAAAAARSAVRREGPSARAAPGRNPARLRAPPRRAGGDISAILIVTGHGAASGVYVCMLCIRMVHTLHRQTGHKVP